MDSGFTSPRNQTRVHGVRKKDTNKYLLCMHPVAAIAGFLVRLLHNTQPIDHFRRKLKVMEEESLFVHAQISLPVGIDFLLLSCLLVSTWRRRKCLVSSV
jgi:hypothetical protein